MAHYLRLQNIPTEADNEDIRRFFHDFEIPEAGVHIIGGKDEEAFIAFRSVNELLKALHSLDRKQLLGKEVKLLLGHESDMETIVRDRIRDIKEAESLVSCADIELKQEDAPPWLKQGKRTDAPTQQKRENNSTEIEYGAEPPWSKRARYTSSHNPSHKKAKHLSSKSRDSVRKTHSSDDKKTHVPATPLLRESSGHKHVEDKLSDGTTVRESQVSNPETSVAITKDRNSPIMKQKFEEAPDTNEDVQEDSKIEPKAKQSEKQKKYSQGQQEEHNAWKERRSIRGSSNKSEFFSEYLSWFPFSGGKTHFYLRLFDLHTELEASEVWTWFDGAYGVILVRSPRGSPRPSQAVVVFKDFACGRSAMHSLSNTNVQSSGWYPQKVLTYLSRLTLHFQISVTTNSGTDHVLSSKQRKYFLMKGFSIGLHTLPASLVKAAKQQTLAAKNPKGTARAPKFKMTPKKKKQTKQPQRDKPMQ